MSMGNQVVDKALRIEHHVNKPIGAKDIVYITLPHLWVLPFYKDIDITSCGSYHPFCLAIHMENNLSPN